MQALHLVRAAGDGGGRFFLHGEVPTGTPVERGSWWLQEGNRPLAAEALGLQGGGAVVGRVPRGLPAVRPPPIDWSVLGRVAEKPGLRHVLLAGHTIERLDAEAAEELVHVLARLGEAGIHVAVSGLRDEVLDMLRRAAGSAAQTRAEFFPTQAKALETLYPEAHAAGDEARCPLREVVPIPE